MPAIGAVFTPRLWARWVIDRFDIGRRWLSGACVLDPTCGQGDFLAALVQWALEQGVAPDQIPLDRLFGIESQPDYLEAAYQRFEDEFGLHLPPGCLRQADLLLETIDLRADILVGNPPWQNFADLPAAYKQQIKPLFLDYGLAPDRRQLLLGSSRIDLAALVIVRAIREHLSPGGHAYFFMPLSLLFNEGAHGAFRNFKSMEARFAIRQIFDFQGINAFPSVNTRYGVGVFVRDEDQTSYVPCFQWTHERWEQNWAVWDGQQGEAFHVQKFLDKLQSSPAKNFKPIPLERSRQPRQGVNTCGANRYLIFSQAQRLDARTLRVHSPRMGTVDLPARFLFPLAGNAQFEDPATPPERYILMPYDRRTGRPLSSKQIARHPALRAYLASIEPALRGRKGQLIRSWMDRGYWWALLGVGPYCFAPVKVMWKAYGADRFEPVILAGHEGQPWQGNQALHAYIPCLHRRQAGTLVRRLSAPAVQTFLESFRMQGTRSWAQPGRIKRLLQFKDESE